MYLNDCNIINNAKVLIEDSDSGYYCIEGTVHSATPIDFQAISLAKFPEHFNNDLTLSSYVRLDENVWGVLNNNINRYIKEVKKIQTNTLIAYPTTVNNVNIDEFIESIPLTFVDNFFKTLRDEPTLPLHHSLHHSLIGVEYEYKGVELGTQVTIYGWYDSINKRMKRTPRHTVVNSDNFEPITVQTMSHPIMITKANKTDVQTYYNSLNKKWKLIGVFFIFIGGCALGSKMMID